MIARASTIDRTTLVAAAVAGALAVGLGAFGAHALKDWLANDVDGALRLSWWQTAAHYHLVHAVLLIAAAFLPTTRAQRVVFVGAVVGITLFSGSLYAMTLSNVRALGAITPLGGVAMITAWVALAFAVPRTTSGAA